MSRQKKIYIILVDYIQSNQDKFYRVAYSYCKSKEDALDIVQDSVFKALKSYKQINSESYISTWFYRILINTSISHLRKRKEVLSFDGVKEGITEDQEYIDLYDAIDNLEAEEKTIIILRFFEDLRLKDMAEVLELNVNTVKTRLYKVLNKLKLKLDWEVENE